MDSNSNNDFELIYSYSRKQALADGVLVDISELAKECGFKYPVAVTSAIWYEYIEVSYYLSKMGQSITGRLWDLLNVLRTYVKKTTGTTIYFETIFLLEENYNLLVKKKVSLKAVCGPDDDGSPCLTIMLPNED